MILIRVNLRLSPVYFFQRFESNFREEGIFRDRCGFQCGSSGWIADEAERTRSFATHIGSKFFVAECCDQCGSAGATLDFSECYGSSAKHEHICLFRRRQRLHEWDERGFIGNVAKCNRSSSSYAIFLVSQKSFDQRGSCSATPRVSERVSCFATNEFVLVIE